MAAAHMTIHVDDDDTAEGFFPIVFRSDGVYLGCVGFGANQILGTPKGLRALAEALITAAESAEKNGVDDGR